MGANKDQKNYQLGFPWCQIRWARLPPKGATRAFAFVHCRTRVCHAKTQSNQTKPPVQENSGRADERGGDSCMRGWSRKASRRNWKWREQNHCQKEGLAFASEVGSLSPATDPFSPRAALNGNFFHPLPFLFLIFPLPFSPFPHLGIQITN